MYPDKALGQDIAFIIIATLICATLLSLTSIDFGYAPRDECANEVINSLSPYQVSQLIDGALPSSYGDVATWCDSHLDDWSARIESARTFPTLPQYDMNL